MLQVQPLENQSEAYLVQYISDSTEEIQTLKEEIIEQIREKTLVSGFRKGKTPSQVIKLKYKKEIDNLLKSKLVQNAYHQILFETKMKPIVAQLQKAELHQDKFWCDYLIFNTPKVELKQYTNLEFSIPSEYENVEERIEKLLGELRHKFANYESYIDEDFVQDGDLIVLNWSISDQSLIKKDEGVSNYIVGQLDSKNKLPKETPNLISGLTLGQEVTKILPDGCTFWCKIEEGKKKVLADLGDELAEKAGFENYQKLLEVLKLLASKQLEDEANKKIASSLVEKLLEVNIINLPEWLIKLKYQELKFGNQINPNLWQIASIQAKVNLLFNAIREQEPELVFSNQELKSIFVNHLLSLGKEETEVKKEIDLLDKEHKMVYVLADLQEKLMIDWLLNKNKLIRG